MSYIMKRPQSPGKISVKTLIAMLVFLKVPNEVLSCTNCGSKIDNILTSEITISEASNCTVNFPEVKVHQVTPKGNDLIVSNLQPGTSYNLSINCSTVCCLQFTTGPDVIRNLTFTQISTSSVSLSWTEPQGKSSFYRVEWDDTEWNGRTVFMNKTTNQTSVNITGLTAGAQYTFAIIAVAEDRNSEGVSVNKMQYTRPDVIRNLTFTQISTSSVSLSWTEPQGKSSFYRVDWDDTVRDGSTVSMNKTTNQTSVNITGLTAGAQYVFSVVAIAADSRTAGDSVQMIRYTRPDVIRTLTFTQISTSSVSLSWTEQQGKSSFYRVEWDDTVRDGSTVFMNKTTNHTSVDIGRLIAGAQYVFSVFVIAGDNKTAGDSISKTQYTRPVKVAIVSGVLEQTGNCSLAIAWTHLGNASSYEVNLTNSALKFQQSKSIIAREASFTGLSPGRIYDVTVTSIAGDLKNTSDIFHFATMPNPVKGLKASPQSTTSVNLTWEPPAGDQLLYKIHVSNSAEPGKDYTEKMVSVLISDLQPGTRYSFTVTPNIANISGPSEVTSGYTYPNPPEGIKVEEQTTSYISISWGRPLSMDPSQYNFTVSQSGHQPVMTAENQALVPNLQSGTQYNISVVTVGPLAYQSMPVWISVTTRPQPVSQLRETEITTSSVTLIWVQPEAKDGYTYGVMVAYPNGTVRNQTVNRPGVRKKGLQSGCSHTFTITTLTADGTPASPRSITITTRPFPIGGLKAITLNTTTVYLNWTQPQKYRPSYSYRVETTGCTSAPKNQSEGSESAYVTDLRSGSNCSFTVYSRVRNDIEGTPVSTSQYTKPDKLTPTVSRSTNDSITVTWESPKGTIEKYVVKLTNSDGENTTEELNSTDQCYRFSGLLAGKAYTVKLNTICGPFSEESEPVLSATYPNQPGPINFNKATTISIYLEWGEAPGMVKGSFNYSVFYELASTIDPTRDQPCNTTTQTNAVNLSDLKSGNIYNISVSSVGPLGFLSQPIRIQVMTKPGSIRHLKVNSTSVEGITLQWEATGDRYRVATENFKIDTELTHYQVKNLTPGTKYTFSVTTLAFDGTEGCQESVTNCTDAAPVTDLTCTGPNLTDAVLVLSWPKPRGANQGFKLHPNNNSLEQCYSNCSHNLTGLLYNKEYTVMIQTLGCGKNSKLTQKVCKTGITVPPVPDTAGMSVTGTEHNRFTLQLSPSLFSDTSGPVRSYGVLVTSDWHSLSGKNKSFLRDYLNKTYDDWTAGSTTTYLAVIKEPENINRNGGSGPVVVVGDGTKSHSYYNGPLGASGTYSFAVVAFTYLDLNKGYVSIATSFFSISKFYHDGIHLPLSPEAIRATVGGTLAALLILILVTVIAAVFWRRLSKKESSDVPMFSIGSAPIRVENYEAYYRQNQAHSNHGFAEQFENLKPVGVAQAKSSAIALDNKGKNRYNNVLPYDSSRVKLSVLGSPYDDYINANFIPGYSSRKEFIAAQGPLPSTVNAFWRMIWEKNVHTLVMLTRCNEMGRVKCEQYWPSGIQHYNSITVTTTSEIPLEDWTMRDFSVKNVKTAETRTVRHFHFTAWPDHGVPETTELLINFRHLVREHMDQYSRHSPTVVHCSAGVGRTGTFIAIDRLIYQIERDSMVDVYGVVHDLRMHRPLMVQTEDQFVFLNQCALDIIRSRTGTNVDLIYQNTAALSIYANCETVKSKNGYHNA